MCGTCGCSTSVATTGVPAIVPLAARVLDRNDRLADETRRRMRERGVLLLNLMSAPGAGKTTLLERTIQALRPLDIAVIEGDQATDADAERVRAAGARAVQINTGAGCHLDAAMVARALDALEPVRGSAVIVENVGNLVCPAMFDLGERARVVLLSVTEGDDKPLKYPHMFRAADLLLLNKTDLLQHIRFDRDRCLMYARQRNPNVTIAEVSATQGDGLAAWYAWLGAAIEKAATEAAAS